MLTTLLLSYFLLVSVAISSEEDIPKDLLDQMFPDPYLNTAKHRLPNSTCLFNLYLNYFSISGTDCIQVPRNTTSSVWKHILLYHSSVEVINSEAFSSWSQSVELRICFNNKLKEVQPGAFNGMEKVEKLTIQDNSHLTHFDSKVFQGLISLKELHILRNNVVSAKDISPALAASILPKLEWLDLSGNSIKVIGDDDFLPMVNTTLKNLRIPMVKLIDVKSKAFLPFTKLEALDLNGNHLNSSVLSPLISATYSAGIDIKTLTLRANMLLDNTGRLFNTIALTNVTTLNLADNQFSKVRPGFFPWMPNIQNLNLSGVGFDDLPKGVIDKSVMPNLKTLSLANNQFSSILPTMMIPSLTKLDLAGNAGALINTAFIIPPKIFSNMTNLDILILSKNDIESLKGDTVSYMDKLKYLIISGAYMHNLYNLTFAGNRQLIYLDISNNDFGGATFLSKDLFKGLDNLQALDMSYCALHHINSDAFIYLKKLKYLSLRGNALTSLPPGVFKYNIHLKILDLSKNSFTSWDIPLFSTQLHINKLFLQNNELSSITPTMIKDLANITVVKINNNQINCNCKLLNDIIITSVRNFTNSSLFSAPNVCLNSGTNSETSIEKYWERVQETNACYVMSTGVKICIGLGVTALVLIIAGVIYYYFKWELIYWSYKLKQQFEWCRWKRSKDKTNQEAEYKFDAFISYCHEDKKFVTKMVAILEGEFGFHLCLYERDFRAGDLISEAVLKSVAASRMTIMILTNSFARSQWCLWELHIAHQRLFYRNSRPDSLIIIKLAEIDDSAMTHTLRQLMNARIYLEWHKSYKKQKVFWQQLKAVIERSK